MSVSTYNLVKLSTSSEDFDLRRRRLEQMKTENIREVERLKGGRIALRQTNNALGVIAKQNDVILIITKF